MRKIIFILAVCCIAVCSSQKLVITNDMNALKKNEANTMKVLLEIYGDSTTNAILMGQVYMLGEADIHFNGNLEIDSISFIGDYWKFTPKAFRQKTEDSIRKQTYFCTTDMKKKQVDEYFAKKGYRMRLFSTVGIYSHLFGVLNDYVEMIEGYESLREEQGQVDIKLVDKMKLRIAEIDAMKIKDVYGKWWK